MFTMWWNINWHVAFSFPFSFISQTSITCLITTDAGCVPLDESIKYSACPGWFSVHCGTVLLLLGPPQHETIRLAAAAGGVEVVVWLLGLGADWFSSIWRLCCGGGCMCCCLGLGWKVLLGMLLAGLSVVWVFKAPMLLLLLGVDCRFIVTSFSVLVNSGTASLWRWTWS